MIRLLSVIIFFTALLGCSQKNGISLEEAVEQFRNNTGSGTEGIATALLQSSASRVLDQSDVHTRGQCLYYNRGPEITLVFPFSFSVKTETGKDLLVSCSMSNLAMSSNGEDVDIYNTEGEKTSRYSLEDAKDKIKAHIIVDNSLYYYCGHKLYQKSLDDSSSILDSDRPFVSHTFKPPYKKYYEVLLVHEGTNIGVVVGSAGYYYINILSEKQRKVLVSNISASSPRISMKSSYVHYITGGSGNWRLLGFNYSSKEKSEIRKFKSLHTIELFSDYFIFEDSHGIWLQDYSREIIRVPFEYEIKGKHKGSVLLKSNDRIYIIDPAVLRSRLGQIEFDLPELFK